MEPIKLATSCRQQKVGKGAEYDMTKNAHPAFSQTFNNQSIIVAFPTTIWRKLLNEGIKFYMEL